MGDNNHAARLLSLIDQHGTHRGSDDGAMYYILPADAVDEIIENMLGPAQPLPSELIARVAALRKKMSRKQPTRDGDGGRDG